jgi:energy-coupling factor transporter ATP-binding protein EcfA2
VRLIYLIGPPGAGKSTLMARLTAAYDRNEATVEGVPMDVLLLHGGQVGVEVGRRRASFSGTDALHLGIHPTACAWIIKTPEPLIFAEGQRLGTSKFLSDAAASGRAVELLWLDPDPATVAARRAMRGFQQSESFVKGATTRAARLAAEMELATGITVSRLAVNGSPEETEAEARSVLGGLPDA